MYKPQQRQKTAEGQEESLDTEIFLHDLMPRKHVSSVRIETKTLLIVQYPTRLLKYMLAWRERANQKNLPENKDYKLEKQPGISRKAYDNHTN